MELRYRVCVVPQGASKPILCVFASDYGNAGRAADAFFKAYPDHGVIIRDCEGIEPDEYLVKMPGTSLRRENVAHSTPFGTRELVDLSLPG
jgi:hypothetical protein